MKPWTGVDEVHRKAIVSSMRGQADDLRRAQCAEVAEALDAAADLLALPLLEQRVVEMPLPADLEGREVLRVIVLKRGMTATFVHAAHWQPDEWGTALHDVAKHVVRAAVKRNLIEESQRKHMLQVIVDAFEDEHERPTDEAKELKSMIKLDS